MRKSTWETPRFSQDVINAELRCSCACSFGTGAGAGAAE